MACLWEEGRDEISIKTIRVRKELQIGRQTQAVVFSKSFPAVWVFSAKQDRRKSRRRYIHHQTNKLVHWVKGDVSILNWRIVVLNDDIISALLKQKENSSSERGRMGKQRVCKEIKKSKGMSEVSERAMNHSDIPGWVSEAAAVWSWINRRSLKAKLFKHWPCRSPAVPLWKT